MSEQYYVSCVGEYRPIIEIPIDDIYCKHETDYSQYRNNYRNQLIDLRYNADERFIIERERNKRLVMILEDRPLYPIALHEIDFKLRDGRGKNHYVCIDGHHRIMAYLESGKDTILGIVYKDYDEAMQAKADAPHTDYYKDLMEIDEEIHKTQEA